MSRYLKTSKDEIGLSPQELVFRGQRKVDEILLRIMDFNESKVEEILIKSATDLPEYLNNESVTWFNVDRYESRSTKKERL